MRRIRPLGELAHFDTTSSIESMPPSSLPSAFRHVEPITGRSGQLYSSRSRTATSSIHSFATDSNRSAATEYHDQTVPLNDVHSTSAGDSKVARSSQGRASLPSTRHGQDPNSSATSARPAKVIMPTARPREGTLDDISDYSFFDRRAPLQDDPVLTPTARKLLLSRPTRLESVIFQPSPSPQVAEPVTPPRRLPPVRRRAPSIDPSWDTGVGRDLQPSCPTSPSPVRATLMTPEGVPDVLDFPSSLRKAKKARKSNSWDDLGGVDMAELEQEVAEQHVPRDLSQPQDHAASDNSNHEAPPETHSSDHAGADVDWNEGIANDAAFTEEDHNAAFAEEDRNATDDEESLNTTLPMWHDPWGFGYMQEWVRGKYPARNSTLTHRPTTPGVQSIVRRSHTPQASALSNNLFANSKRRKRGARNGGEWGSGGIGVPHSGSEDPRPTRAGTKLARIASSCKDDQEATADFFGFTKPKQEQQRCRLGPCSASRP